MHPQRSRDAARPCLPTRVHSQKRCAPMHTIGMCRAHHLCAALLRPHSHTHTEPALSAPIKAQLGTHVRMHAPLSLPPLKPSHSSPAYTSQPSAPSSPSARERWRFAWRPMSTHGKRKHTHTYLHRRASHLSTAYACVPRQAPPTGAPP